MHTARSRQDFLLICFLCACLAIGIVYVIMFQIISKHKLRNKEIQKLLQKNESLLLSDKQEMEKKDIALQTIQKQLEENHLLIDSLTETIQTLENDNLSQLEIYKQQQEEANIEQSKLLKEKETILKQKEEYTIAVYIRKKWKVRATYSSFNKRERRIGKTKKCTKPRTGCKCKGAKTTEPGLGVTAASARRTIAKRTRGSR